MTPLDELERGDIIWATDPLSEKGRPVLVIGTPKFQSHGVQLITALISTKSYHESALALSDDDYEGEPLGEQSHVLPWSLVTLNSAVDVDHYLPSLVADRTEDVVRQVVAYISA